MAHLQRTLMVLSILVTCSQAVCGQETSEGTKKKIEARSPDGQFAFRYTGESDSEEKQTYDLIDKRSGKVLTSVAESDPDLGPSARFYMKVLWKPDSKAFALTATLWKRGSNVEVYLRNGSTFSSHRNTGAAGGNPRRDQERQKFPACLRTECAEREAMAKGWFARCGDRNDRGW